MNLKWPIYYAFMTALSVGITSCKSRSSRLKGNADVIKEQMSKPTENQVVLVPGNGYDMLTSDDRASLENRLQPVLASKHWYRDVLIPEPGTSELLVQTFKLTATFKFSFDKKVELTWLLPAPAIFAAPTAARFLVVAFEENMFAGSVFQARHITAPNITASFLENGFYIEPEPSLADEPIARTEDFGIFDQVKPSALKGDRSEPVVTIVNHKGPPKSALNLKPGTLFLMSRNGQAEASAFGIWQGLTLEAKKFDEYGVNALALASLEESSREALTKLGWAIKNSEKITLVSTSVSEFDATPATKNGKIIVGIIDHDLKEANPVSLEEYQKAMREVPESKATKGRMVGGAAAPETSATSTEFAGKSVWQFEQFHQGARWRIVVVATPPTVPETPRKVEMIRIYKAKSIGKTREYEYMTFKGPQLSRRSEDSKGNGIVEVAEASSIFSQIIFRRYPAQNNLCQIEYSGAADFFKGIKFHLFKDRECP